MSEQKLLVGADMICPVTKEHCDDECCTPGSICNCQPTSHIVSGDLPKDEKPIDLQKAVLGAKVMTRFRNYAGQYLLTLEGCPHVYKHVFKMNGPEGEKLIQVDDEGKRCRYLFYNNDDPNTDDLIMAPEVKTVWVNFFLDSKDRVVCTMPLTSEAEVSPMDSTWRFIKTEKIVLEY